MKQTKLSVQPDTIKVFVVKNTEDIPIAFISVTGNSLMISTEKWSNCTIEDVTELGTETWKFAE